MCTDTLCRGTGSVRCCSWQRSRREQRYRAVTCLEPRTDSDCDQGLPRCFSQDRLDSLGACVETPVTDKACYYRVLDGCHFRSRIALDYPAFGKPLDHVHGCGLPVQESRNCHLPRFCILEGRSEAMVAVFVAYAWCTGKCQVLSLETGLCEQRNHRLVPGCCLIISRVHSRATGVPVTEMGTSRRWLNSYIADKLLYSNNTLIGNISCCIYWICEVGVSALCCLIPAVI